VEQETSRILREKGLGRVRCPAKYWGALPTTEIAQEEKDITVRLTHDRAKFKDRTALVRPRKARKAPLADERKTEVDLMVMEKKE